MKNYRRTFLKTLFNIGILSLIPIRINAFNNFEDCDTTTDIEGPFYIANSPNISILNPPETLSNLLFMTGTVYANDCITPIPNAVIDVWHANEGQYDETTDSYLNSQYEDSFYRAKIYTDENGNYAYQTILPGKYLNGSYYRPSHIHYKSSYLNQNEITTQLYFSGDTSIPIDPWASSDSAEDRIIPLIIDENNNFNGVFDIGLDVNPEEVQQTEIKENQIIKSIFPNPINSNSHIFLNIQSTNLSLDICDINGKTIANLENINKSKIRVYDILGENTKRGIYILRIKKNGKGVNAKRFII